MIVPDSPKSEADARSSGRMEVPPSPPPYSATIASSNDPYQDGSHSSQPTSSRTNPSIRPNLPPRCNHFIDRKTFSGVTGTWHVDTGLEIPERLLLPVPKFDGYWNREAQRTRKTRADELRKRTSDSKSDSPLPPAEIRPNLMLATTNGVIGGDIHVISSDGLARQVTLVAEGFNGSVNLKIHAPPDQSLRVFASTTNSSINIKVPSSFEGAVMMSTTWGSVNISEPVKAKLTTFSSASNTSRGFIGDWQARGFGATPNSNNINDEPPSGQNDPFSAWTGPLIEIASTNGSVSLSYTEEGVISACLDQFTKAIQGFKDSWFGGGQGETTVGGNSLTPPSLLQSSTRPTPSKS